MTAVGLLLVLAQVLQAWALWPRETGGSRFGPVGRGELCAVMLVNGQVYYGEFVAADASHVRLQNVYYVQAGVDSATSQPSNRLVSRRKADWHAPVWMSIATDKVVLLEAVGSESRLAQLVAQDSKTEVKR